MSGDGELSGSAPGFLGPVEAVGGTLALPPPDTRRELTKRQGRVLAALLLAGALALLARGAEPPGTPPPSYPSQLSHITYGGVVRAATGPGGEFELRVLARDDGPGPYEITAIRQEYRGLTVAPTGALPRRVTPKAATEIVLVYRVTDCGAAPPDAGLPFLDVTLRNARAAQTVSQILGSGYAADLSSNLHLVCPNSGIRTSASAATYPDTVVR
jgi:hypothetical protein